MGVHKLLVGVQTTSTGVHIVSVGVQIMSVGVPIMSVAGPAPKIWRPPQSRGKKHSNTFRDGSNGLGASLLDWTGAG